MWWTQLFDSFRSFLNTLPSRFRWGMICTGFLFKGGYSSRSCWRRGDVFLEVCLTISRNFAVFSPQCRDVVSFDRRWQVVTCLKYPRSGYTKYKRGLSPTWVRHTELQFVKQSDPRWWTAPWIRSKYLILTQMTSLVYCMRYFSTVRICDRSSHWPRSRLPAGMKLKQYSDILLDILPKFFFIFLCNKRNFIWFWFEYIIHWVGSITLVGV